MKSMLFVLAYLLNSYTYGQKLNLTIFTGVSNYIGDLQSKRFLINQAKPAASIGLSYQVSDKLVFRSLVTYSGVAGNDKYNTLTNQPRNLNFTSKIVEGHVAAEYYLRSLDQYWITPYFLLGVGVYHFNPATKDSAGVTWYLANLRTEGQGFNNRRPYSLWQVCIPFGGGVKYAVNEKFCIGVEVGIRKLFTDYLDDVSTTYADKDLLLSKGGAKAVELAYRGSGSYPQAGSQRGSSTHNDWYYFVGINAAFLISENHHQKAGFFSY
jgi:hypothetical protein